jgi:hypothetical protein
MLCPNAWNEDPEGARAAQTCNANGYPSWNSPGAWQPAQSSPNEQAILPSVHASVSNPAFHGAPWRQTVPNTAPEAHATQSALLLAQLAALYQTHQVPPHYACAHWQPQAAPSGGPHAVPHEGSLAAPPGGPVETSQQQTWRMPGYVHPSMIPLSAEAYGQALPPLSARPTQGGSQPTKEDVQAWMSIFPADQPLNAVEGQVQFHFNRELGTVECVSCKHGKGSINVYLKRGKVTILPHNKPDLQRKLFNMIRDWTMLRDMSASGPEPLDADRPMPPSFFRQSLQGSSGS